MLNPQAGAGFGVVRGPHLIGPREHGEVRAPAAAGAALKGHVWMSLAQGIPHPVHALHIAHPQRSRLLHTVPAGFGGVAVHIPFDERNIKAREQAIQHRNQVVLNLFSGQVENQLVPHLGARPCGKVDGPVGVGAVEVGVGTDHLWFHPQAKVHSQCVHL